MAQAITSAWKIIPEFQSTSIPTTITFYTIELNFILGGSHPPPPSTSEPTFCSIFIGDKAAANIYFRRCAPEDFHPSKAWIAMGTGQLEEFHEWLKGKGNVEIVEAIGDMEWGYRQFAIKDCDGNVITFFRFLEGGNPGEEEGEDSK